MKKIISATLTVVTLILATSTLQAGEFLKIKNPSMEAGDSNPSFWKIDWKSSGSPTLIKDTKEFHSGKASLKLNTNKAHSYCTASQTFDVWKYTAKGGKKFTVSGYYKAKGKMTKCGLAIKFVDKKWKQLDWIPLVTAKQSTKAQKWTYFKSTLKIPDNAVKAAVKLVVEGTGILWVDDIKIEEVKVK